MAKTARMQPPSTLTEVKSKFDAEYRRFSVDASKTTKCADFYKLVETIHRLNGKSFFITYTDCHGDQLPINNDDNYMKALTSACLGSAVLRMQLQRKEDAPANGFGTPSPTSPKHKKLMRLLSGEGKMTPRPKTTIGFPEDFRLVSAIVDVDLVPQTHRRVKLMKENSSRDAPLGFYIRRSVSTRVKADGSGEAERVPSVIISRLLRGGLADSSGLLAIGDEVVEVNGISVEGKSIDQVTDMMVANSSNLIVTVRPMNQDSSVNRRQPITKMPLAARRSSPATFGSSSEAAVYGIVTGGCGRRSGVRPTTLAASPSHDDGSRAEEHDGEEEEDDDDVCDHLRQ